MALAINKTILENFTAPIGGDIRSEFYLSREGLTLCKGRERRQRDILGMERKRFAIGGASLIGSKSSYIIACIHRKSS